MQKYRMRHTLFIIILSIFASLQVDALAPVKWNQKYQDYIDKYRDIAICEMLEHNIPASITLAQGLLESGAGESVLSTKGNNHFGIKSHGWGGPTMKKDDDKKDELFRVYESAYDSYEDHSRFLERPRYKELFSLRRTDYEGWARGLKKCGYATNPRYAQLLIDIIRCYNLSDLDRATSYNPANVRRPGSSMLAKTTPTKFDRHISMVGNEHVVKMNNGNYYVIARQGDTFRSIANEFDLSYKKISRYNERNNDDVLDAGDIVYLEKKRSKADKMFKDNLHIAKAGESMYSIAQMYGVKLKSLYKKNHLSADYQLRVGDKIKVY